MQIVLIYRDSFKVGGFPREVHLLASAIARNGLPIEVVGRGGTPGDAFGFETTVLQESPLQFGWSIFKHVADGDQARVVLLVDNGTFHGFVASLALWLRGVPHILSIGDVVMPLHGSKGLRRLLRKAYLATCLRLMVKNSGCVRVYSKYHEWCTQQLFPGVETFLETEGIDWEQVHRGAAPRARVDVPRFGFLGRKAVHTKGLDLLLEGWLMFVAQGGIGTLVIAGPDTEEWLDLTKKWSQPSISELGALDVVEKALFMQSLTALIAPSRHEGVPRVLREATALGVPIIASAPTNFCDLVERFSLGVAMEDLTSMALASALHEITSMVDGDFEAARAHLEWDSIAARLIGELSSVWLAARQ